MPGEPHPSIPDLWVYESPEMISRLPHVVILYTIDVETGTVVLENIIRLS